MNKLGALAIATAFAASGATIKLTGSASLDLTGTYYQITTIVPPGDGCCVSTTYDQSWVGPFIRVPYRITFPKLDLPSDADVTNIRLFESTFPVEYSGLPQRHTQVVTPLCAGPSCNPLPTEEYGFGLRVVSPLSYYLRPDQWPTEQQLRDGSFLIQNTFWVEPGEIGGSYTQIGRASKTVNRWETNATLYHRATIEVDYTVPASDAIPEPGTLLLSGAGVLFLFYRTLRRQP